MTFDSSFMMLSLLTKRAGPWLTFTDHGHVHFNKASLHVFATFQFLGDEGIPVFVYGPHGAAETAGHGANVT